MGSRAPTRVDHVFAIQVRAFERSLELTAEIYAVVVKLREAIAAAGSRDRETSEVFAIFKSLRGLFEPNAIRLDSATCECIEALLVYHAAFADDGEAAEPEIGIRVRNQLAATMRHLEIGFRGCVGMK